MKGVVYSCDTEIIVSERLKQSLTDLHVPKIPNILHGILKTKLLLSITIQAPTDYYRDYRITLDTIEDFKLLGVV